VGEGILMFGRGPKARSVLQMEVAECGAACLVMVLSAHGRHIALEEARDRCGTSRDGVDAAALARAAESYGLAVKALRREPEALADVPLPAILHWSFNHFVVLVEISRTQFVILDPASGRRTIDAAEMNRCFTGLALAMEPGEAFKPGGERPSVAGALLEHLRGSWDAVGLVLLCGLAAIVPGLALSGAVATFADHVIGQNRIEWLLFVVAALATIALLQAGLGALREWTVTSLKTKIAVVVAARAFRHALFLPLSFFAQRHASELVSRLRIGSELGATVAGPLVQMPPNVVAAVGYLAVIFLCDPAIGALVAVVSLFNLLVLNRLSQRLVEANRLQHVMEGVAGGVATAGFASFEGFRLLGRQDLLARRWLAAEEAALDAEQRLGLLRTLAGLGPAAAALLVVTTVLCVGALRVMQGDLTLGSMLALQVLAGLCSVPIAAIASDYCQIQEAAGALMRLDDLQRHPRDSLVAVDVLAMPAVSNRRGLVIEEIGFAFGVSPEPLFNRVSLTLEPGTLTALTGASGAGKSTLAKIAAGLLMPDRGKVLLDGVPIVQWPRAQLRSRLMYVAQTSAVFTGTIAENVALWDKAIPQGDVVAALKLAGVDHIVAARAGGLAAALDHQAPCFSGGEVQRLALARALAQRPDVLILDETTSALDPLCEEEVIAGLRRTGAAVLIVTHRASAAARCDRVLHLAGNGNLIAIDRASRDDPAPVRMSA
jgi:ABC-type bacteriocin/lantibiotic exporter with double-glycine peptidase domain